MPKLIIDDITVEVPEGTTVLEAARSVDIPIPHFCWHPALGKAGACRVCAVKMLDGPVKGIQMSCMLPAQDGMVVSTTDSEAVAMRRLVIEWLMINHPHDCPVCDEGGGMPAPGLYDCRRAWYPALQRQKADPQQPGSGAVY